MNTNNAAYEFWRSTYNIFGAPAPAVPGVNPWENPYAFTIPGAAASYGIPPAMAQGQIGQLASQFAPMLASFLTGDPNLGNRLVSNNQAFLGNVMRARHSEEIMRSFNASAQKTMTQNLGAVIDNTALGGFAKQMGFSGQDAAGFFMQAAPFLDPRTVNVLNRLDPGGGSLGLGMALYQGALSGTGNTQVTAQTAGILGDQFRQMYTRQMGDFQVLDTGRTSGLTLTQMAVLRQQARARGLVGDALAGADGSGLIRELASGAEGRRRTELLDVARQLDAGDLSDAEAFTQIRRRGLASTETIEATQERMVGRNLESERPRMEQLSRSITEAGAIFESLADNIPALMSQVEKMVGGLRDVNESEVRKALSDFQALVELSGTTAEVLANQAEVIQSRAQVSFSRAANLATDVNLTSTALMETGNLTTEQARRLADTVVNVESEALKSQAAQAIGAASMFIGEEGPAADRMRRAIEESDADFLANPVQALIEEGLLTGRDAEDAQRLMARIRRGELLSNEELSTELERFGLNASDVAIGSVQSRTLDRIRRGRGEGFFNQGRLDVLGAFNRAGGTDGGALLDVDDEQLLQMIALGQAVEAGDMAADEALSIMERDTGITGLDEEGASRFFRSIAGIASLDRNERIALSAGSLNDIKQKERARNAARETRISEQTERILKTFRNERGIPGLINLLQGNEEGAVGVVKAALEASGFALNEDMLNEITEEGLTDFEREELSRLQGELFRAEDPEERERIFKEINRLSADIGKRFNVPTDQLTGLPREVLARGQLREIGINAAGVDRLSMQTMDAIDELNTLRFDRKSAEERLEAARKEKEANPNSKEAREELLKAGRALEDVKSKEEAARKEVGKLLGRDSTSSEEQIEKLDREQREKAEKEREKEGREEEKSEEGDEKTRYEKRPQQMQLRNARIRLEAPNGTVIIGRLDTDIETSEQSKK